MRKNNAGTRYRKYAQTETGFKILSEFLKKEGIYIVGFEKNIFNRGQIYHFLGTSVMLYSRKISSSLDSPRGLELTVVSNDIKKSEKVVKLLDNYVKNPGLKPQGVLGS